jgi:hypothetical protein
VFIVSFQRGFEDAEKSIFRFSISLSPVLVSRSVSGPNLDPKVHRAAGFLESPNLDF